MSFPENIRQDTPVEHLNDLQNPIFAGCNSIRKDLAKSSAFDMVIACI